MLKPISVLSMTVFLVACGGSGSAGLNNNAGGNDSAPSLGAAQPEGVDTKTLEVGKDFSFATARTVDIEFDIAAVQGNDATVTICTEYTPVAEEFDVNFGSCAISGSLEDGVFSQSMEITNDKDAVVAVVLFQDPEIPPMYKEFSVDDNLRSKGDGSSARVISWK